MIVDVVTWRIFSCATYTCETMHIVALFVFTGPDSIVQGMT